MKGRSLEDINFMFEENVATREFGSYMIEEKVAEDSEGGKDAAVAQEKEITPKELVV